jgi:hypothetical protein
MVKTGCKKQKKKHKWKSVKRDLIHMMGVFCLAVPQKHTHRDTDQTDREAKKWERCNGSQGKQKEVGRREKQGRCISSKWSNICKREETYSKSLPKPKTSKPNKKKKTHKRTKKREIAFDSPPSTEKIFGNNKYKLQKTTKQNKTKTEKMLCCKLFCSCCWVLLFISLSLSLSLSVFSSLLLQFCNDLSISSTV